MSSSTKQTVFKYDNNNLEFTGVHTDKLNERGNFGIKKFLKPQSKKKGRGEGARGMRFIYPPLRT